MSGVRAVVERVGDRPAAAAEFGADYWDCFRLTGDRSTSARNWATLSLRGAEASGGAFSRVVWGGLLGFDLAPLGAPGTLVGWSVSAESSTQLVLDVDGSLMAGRMVFAACDDRVTWTTMLRYHSIRGHLVWTIASSAHRALVPRCLVGAHVALPGACNVQH